MRKRPLGGEGSETALTDRGVLARLQNKICRQEALEAIHEGRFRAFLVYLSDALPGSWRRSLQFALSKVAKVSAKNATGYVYIESYVRHECDGEIIFVASAKQNTVKGFRDAVSKQLNEQADNPVKPAFKYAGVDDQDARLYELIRKRTTGGPFLPTESTPCGRVLVSDDQGAHKASIPAPRSHLPHQAPIPLRPSLGCLMAHEALSLLPCRFRSHTLAMDGSCCRCRCWCRCWRRRHRQGRCCSC